jgi:hypothetical protein
MRNDKWLLSAGHRHLFHIVAPIVARARGYFEEEGAGECDFFCSGSDVKTIEGIRRGEEYRLHYLIDQSAMAFFSCAIILCQSAAVCLKNMLRLKTLLKFRLLTLTVQLQHHLR